VFRDPVANIVSPRDGRKHVGRGGNYYLSPITLRGAFRQALVYDEAFNALGFRCARAAK
jgi:formylglycine-generating enzyme required for sulfatase activity